MTTERRNALFYKHQGLIKSVIRNNHRLLVALQLESEDVAQDLAIRLMSAIEKFDPERSKSMASYLSYSLQYEILNMKKRHKPHGITQIEKGNRLKFLFLNQEQPGGYTYELPVYDDTSALDISEFHDRLQEPEIETLNLKMEGFYLRQKAQKSMLTSVRDKFTALYGSERSMVA